MIIAVALIGCCNLVYGQRKKQRPAKVEDQKVTTPINNESETSNRAFVELYDGSSFIGEITSDNMEVLGLRLIGDNEISLKYGYIKSIKREGNNFTFTKNGRYNYNRGVFCNIMPLGLGAKIDAGGTYSSQLVLGYQLNNRLGIGGGFGVENFSARISNNWFSFTFIPTFAYAKYNINLNGPRVYALGKLGFAQTVDGWWRQEINTSLYTALGFGVAFPSKWVGRLVLELSNSMVLTEGRLEDWDFNGNPVVQNFNSLMSRSTLKIGIGLGQ